MFKVGDRVRLKTEQTQFGIKYAIGEEGEVLDIVYGTPPLVKISMFLTCKIMFISPMDIEHWMPNNTLPNNTLPNNTLPAGNQPNLFGRNTTKEAMLEAVDNADISLRHAFVVLIKCDCGGLKTHGSLESMFHSYWCSTQLEAK